MRDLDPIFHHIQNLYGPPTPVVRPEGFESLCKIIFEQQVSLESAKACYDKLLATMGNFTPENLLKLDDGQLRAAGLSRQKASYVRNLAEAIVSGDLDLMNLRSKTADEARKELLKIKGIGNWTADVYMMFCLQSPDIIPLSDIGIVVTIRELWGIEGKDEMERLSENWKPHRTLASFFLWHYYLRKRNRVIHA